MTIARLNDKVALVTGSGREIGQAMSVREAALATGRRNRPEDIAAMAAFLASPDADNITGQAYNVDGGMVMVA